MYLIDSSPIVDGVVQNNMLGPQMLAMFGMSSEWYKDADKIEIWGTSFKDNGSDFCVIKFYKGQQLLREKRVEGY